MERPLDLKPLFNPASVAIFGVSGDPKKLSRITVANLIRNGYGGRIYPLNPALQQIDELPCYPDLKSLNAPVDVAFMAIQAPATVDAVRECAAAGVRFAVIGSAGFAESGPEGKALQDELSAISRETGLRIVGPNCNGIYSTSHRLALGFNTGHSRAMTPGNVALISHSGALFDTMASILFRHGAGLSFFVSAGNEADLDLLDYLEFAVADPATQVIALLLDALSDGTRFRALAQRASVQGKRIVVFRIGSSEQGAEAAEAHCSRLASSEAAYQSLFQSARVSVVHSLEALMTASALLSRFGRRVGGVGALTVSGAGAAILLDSAERFGCRLTRYSAQTQEALEARRLFSKIGNPTDYGAFGAMRSVFAEVPSLIAGDGGVAVMLALVHSMNDYQRLPYIEALAGAVPLGKPIIILTPGGLQPGERAEYEAHGFVCISDTDCAMQSMAAILSEGGSDASLDQGRSGNRSGVVIDAAEEDLLSLERPLTEPESLGLLARFGVPVVRTHRCVDLQEALAALASIGGPVAVKGVVHGVTHKTERGLVRTGIVDAAALEAAFASMGECTEFIVQPMIEADLEVIVGLKRTDDLGNILIAGLGGVFAEALNQVSVWVPPVSREQIRLDLERSSLGRILTSPRWRWSNSFETLIDAIDSLQAFSLWAGSRIDAVDINPLRVGRAGCIAVDALVVPRGSG